MMIQEKQFISIFILKKHSKILLLILFIPQVFFSSPFEDKISSKIKSHLWWKYTEEENNLVLYICKYDG